MGESSHRHLPGSGFFVLSREDLIASKKAAGREVDLEDVRLLELEENEE